MLLRFVVSVLFLSVSIFCYPKEYFVSKSGSDENDGAKTAPFLTISKAASLARAGDRVIVHEGVYREQISLKHSGKGENQRIIFEAAEGEQVAIKGSEIVKGWSQQGNIWVKSFDNKYFGKFNPFKALVRYPKPVTIDKDFDQTGWQTYGLKVHRGNVFMEGAPLKEVFSLDEVQQQENTWYAKVKGSKTQLFAHFSQNNPNQALTEIITRGKWFAATKKNINFITLKGFKLHHAGTFWAPPTVYQPGAIEPNGGNHWIIEWNDIGYARAVCISVGIPKGGAANMQGNGHHIIRHNRIKGCGQAAIAGQFYGDHSKIYQNLIEDINLYREFGGWETAGIKLHHNDYSLIEKNWIRGVFSKDPEKGAAHGIWIDYENTNTVINGNVVLDTDSNPILLEANWNGPFLIANNILMGKGKQATATHSSKDGIWIHNLLVDSKPEWVNQTFGGRPRVSGDRWFNNIFIGDSGLSNVLPKTKDFLAGSNLYLDGASPYSQEQESVVVSAIPSNFNFEMKKDGIIKVSFDINQQGLSTSGKLVRGDWVGYSVENSNDQDVYLENDVLGNKRSQKPQWGPFENLKEGKNEFDLTIEIPSSN